MPGKRLTAISLSCNLFLLGGFIVCASQARADESSKAIQRARSFLDSESVGRDVLTLVHMGARYDGHEFNSVQKVNQADEILRGHFALIYDFRWEGDGLTKLAFICDPRGHVYGVQVLDSNGVINTPFALSKLSLDVVGNGLVEAFKDQMSSQDRARLKALISNADPKAMLEMLLQIRQAVER
jgi:hypothetical protein